MFNKMVFGPVAAARYLGFFVYVLNLLHTCLLFVLSYLQAYFLALGNFMFAAASMQMQFPGCAPA